jgi:hypothetical protein
VNPAPSDIPEDAAPAAIEAVSYEGADQDTVLLRRQPFWKKIGGDGLVVSIIIHAVLLILFGAWVVSSWTDSAKTDPDTFATGSGGGAAGERAKVFEHKLQPKNAKNLAKTTARITSKSSSAALALPDIPSTSSASLLSGMTGGGSSKGFGGGSGGGIGSGKGVGVGNGRNFVGAFGGSFKRANSLEGTLYDLKFSGTGKALGSDPAERVGQLRRAMQTLDRSWSSAKTFLDGRYKHAELKLYASNIFIPPRSAGEATKAFECEKEIQAPGWLAYYEGWFAVPETGEYRLVGLGDDIMIAAINGKSAFAAFWPGAALGDTVDFGPDWLPKDADKKNGANLKFPPNQGGRYSGGWVKLQKGTAHRIQIAFGESYGGLFGAQLLIERKGEKYQNSGREDLLPVFMLEPMTADEVKLKDCKNIDYVTEGPSFGVELNNVTVRSTSR